MTPSTPPTRSGSAAAGRAESRPESDSKATPAPAPELLRRGQAELINAVGLHARPAVRFTQTAKSFQSRIEVALTAEGPWADAKSPVQVMRLRAPLGSVLHLQVQGPDADAALEALLNLVRRGFESSQSVENSQAIENSRG